MTRLASSISPIRIETKVGNHVIDKNLIKPVLLAAFADLGIPKERILITVQQWELKGKSKLKKGKLSLEFDLKGLEDSPLAIADLLMLQINYQEGQLDLDLSCAFNKQLFFVCEAETDLILEKLQHADQYEQKPDRVKRSSRATF